MASLCTAVDTPFTPAAGDFMIQVTGAPATLMRKNASAATIYAPVGEVIGAFNVSNPIAGAVYKFTSTDPATVVRADQ